MYSSQATMLGSSYRACGELEEAEPSNGFMLGIVHRLRDCKHPVAGANHGAYANHTTVITWYGAVHLTSAEGRQRQTVALGLVAHLLSAR